MFNLEKFAEACYRQHDVECNQKYNDYLPYSFHIKMVIAQHAKFAHLLDSEERIITRAGCDSHDLIEDARMNWNAIIALAMSYGATKSQAERIADIVILCTEFSRGKTRAERKPEEFYIALQSDKLAAFVKLCDIIANSLFSCLSNSSMFEKYKKEFPKLLEKLSVHTELLPMLKYLEDIYCLKP